MAVRKIIRMGHPTLRKVASPVPDEMLGSAELQLLLQDMVDTLHDYGGVGLAAPQVDESLRLAIIEIPEGPSRYGELQSMPLTVFINPVITPVPGAEVAGFWEGCLSVPGLRGFVERPQHVKVDYLDEQGQPQQLELTGFFQHEFDHLDGRLYVDHIKDMSKLSFEDELIRYSEP